MTDRSQFKSDFLLDLDPVGLLGLFEHLPGTGFWIKDRQGRIVANNRIGILRKMGCSVEADVVGKTDFDFFPKAMAARFMEADLRVATTGASISNRLELVLNLDGKVEWHKTTKLPLRDRKGALIGSAGITVALGKPHVSREVPSEMLRVIEYIQKHIADPIYLDDMARVAGLSARQFERRFKQEFHISPIRFVIQFRIKKACQALARAKTGIVAIGMECGFPNAAVFSSQFKREMRISPQAYRRKYSAEGPRHEG